MKKVIAIIMAMLMLGSLNWAALADDTASQKLQEVLIEVKTKVDIPASLSEFEGDVQTYNNQILVGTMKNMKSLFP